MEADQKYPKEKRALEQPFFSRYHFSIFLYIITQNPKLSRKLIYKHENSERFPCLYHIPRFSTAFSVTLILFSPKPNNIPHLFTFPFYTITETPDFCVKVYFCLRVPKFLWHYFWIAAWAAVRYFLSLPAQDSAPFKPFNDCLLSLKGGAKSEGETASETEKRLKNRKNKMAESVKRLIFRHFSNFALYQFRCCDVSICLRIFSR